MKKSKLCIPQPQMQEQKQGDITSFFFSQGTTLGDSAEINNLPLKTCGQPLHSE